MFGLIFAGFTALCHAVKGIQTYAYNVNSKANCPYNETYDYPMYVDNKGRWRDSYTNEILFVGNKNVNGEVHQCIYAINTQYIKKDITAEKQKNALKNAKDNGETTVRMTPGTYVDSYRSFKSPHWRDIETGDIYVIREMKGVFDNKLVRAAAYMRVSDGKFVRLTERYNLSDKKEYQLLLDIYNQKQEQYKQENNGKVDTYLGKMLEGAELSERERGKSYAGQN